MFYYVWRMHVGCWIKLLTEAAAHRGKLLMWLADSILGHELMGGAGRHSWRNLANMVGAYTISYRADWYNGCS